MAMNKVIKEFNINNYTYQLGYDLYHNKVYPIIEIWKDGEVLSGGLWNNGTSGGLFYFETAYSSSDSDSAFGSIKELFIKLREYSEVPQNIEIEFENIYLLYKLNDFNE